jgi:hypothetical protein
MERSAVEWFYDKVIQKQYKDIDDSLEDLFEQAKELEKEQEKKMYSEEEVMGMFDKFSMHLPLHYEFLVKEQFKKK